VKIVLALENFFYRLRRSPFRAFVHPTEAVEAILLHNGLKRHFYHQTWVWQVVVYSR
jgi:hypothetical protein